MKAALIVLGVFFGLLISIGGFLFYSYVSAHNSAVRMEKSIEAAWENNENILAQYGQKIAEAAQIPSMQKEDLTALFTGSIEARYGEGGSKAAFQWLQEQNPNLDQSTYKKIQTMIEAGRNKFENAQTALIDRKREYSTALGLFWKGLWMRIAGFPKIDLADYEAITTTRASDTFESGVESSPLQLRTPQVKPETPEAPTKGMMPLESPAGA